ncbi:hypothetical protein CXF85_21565 [Colwellia sp. 75C3]|uniref:hypothetical protein n=1 Tax=Colwellia sp. 75C3 TaxID=888425 RepID=UPI000C339FBC|nr:hypothetical protein [Colwellia sp. 75C3]PKG80709.1 hypothetical protein CXF85_21565 [Colwellia sp. 75C3]
MPRITNKEYEERREVLNDIILQMFFDKGWDYLTYGTIAEASGFRRSTIQGYFKTSNDFSKALAGKVFPYILSKLSLDSRAEFVKSWDTSIDDDKFRYIITMLIRTATDDTKVSPLAVAGLNRLIALITSKLGDDAYQDLEILLGRTVLKLANR